MSRNQSLLLIVILFFLGFSPISEPHIIGKIKWIFGGAKEMEAMDWFDVILHGGSLIIAVILIFSTIYSRFIKK